MLRLSSRGDISANVTNLTHPTIDLRVNGHVRRAIRTLLLSRDVGEIVKMYVDSVTFESLVSPDERTIVHKKPTSVRYTGRIYKLEATKNDDVWAIGLYIKDGEVLG